MLRDTPIDPIPTAFGSILLLPEGRCILQFDRLPDTASDWDTAYANRLLAVLADMGHCAYVGAPAQFALVREACRED